MKTMMPMAIVGAALVGLGCSDDPAFTPHPPTPSEMEFVTTSDNYLNNRFFMLDLALPGSLPNHDVPGRDASQQRIDRGSIHVYQLVTGGGPKPDDISNIAAYLDTTGVFWTCPDCPPNHFRTPVVYGARWRELAFSILATPDDELDGLDLGVETGADDALAVIYDVTGPSGTILYSVGDRPDFDPPLGDLPGEDAAFYRMKLLKAPEGVDEYSFQYVKRNIYYLGQTNIDPGSFRLAIEESSIQYPHHNEHGIPYIRIFGLDRRNITGAGRPDGLVDISDYRMLDLRRGLVRFPMGKPFDASQSTYEAYADSSAFNWDGSYLQGHQAEELYDPRVPSANYWEFSYFRLRATCLMNQDNS